MLSVWNCLISWNKRQITSKCKSTWGLCYGLTRFSIIQMSFSVLCVYYMSYGVNISTPDNVLQMQQIKVGSKEFAESILGICWHNTDILISHSFDYHTQLCKSKVYDCLLWAACLSFSSWHFIRRHMGVHICNGEWDTFHHLFIALFSCINKWHKCEN